MSWNYRIVREVHKVGDREYPSYDIREVYYDDEEDNNKITSWTSDSCYPSGDTWIECGEDLAIMGRAIGAKIVDISTGKAIEMDTRQVRELDKKYE